MLDDTNGWLFLFVDTSVPSQIVTLVANPNTYFLFCRPFHPPAPMKLAMPAIIQNKKGPFLDLSLTSTQVTQ